MWDPFMTSQRRIFSKWLLARDPKRFSYTKKGQGFNLASGSELPSLAVCLNSARVEGPEQIGLSKDLRS